MTTSTTQNDIEKIKIAILGSCGVGKTCITTRYIKNEYNKDTKSTDGANYQQKIFTRGNKTVQFDIWDTAGQELYRALARNFYLNASIGILVYDIRRKDSFESIKDYWYDQLKNSGEENIVFGVAGNKCDLFQEEKVTEKEAKEFANQIGAVFQLTSCKESIGIDELFEELGRKYLEKNNLIDKDSGNNQKEGGVTLSKADAKNNRSKNRCCK